MKKETEKLLRECTAGTKMGERAISLTLSGMCEGELKSALEESLTQHAIIGDEARKMLYSAHRREKEPNPIVLAMSDAKIKMRLAVNNSPTTVASLITDGCDMGTKSVARAINHNPSASDASRQLAKRLIEAEDSLRQTLRKYL